MQPPSYPDNTLPPLRILLAGNVDDGKSTLLGRLFYDTKSLKNDQYQRLLHHTQNNQLDFAKLSDGLQSETTQSITIDIAHYYLDTQKRRLTLLDTPGHPQYTRNMVTAATTSDAAVILVDATKINRHHGPNTINEQTQCHITISLLLRVPSIIFAINKLDVLADPAQTFLHIKNLLEQFIQQFQKNNHQNSHTKIASILPISALHGLNVVHTVHTQYTPHQPIPTWAETLADVYTGNSLLDVLTSLPATPAETALPLHYPIQWIDSNTCPSSADTQTTSPIFWGRIATGKIKTGDNVTIMPTKIQAEVTQIKTNALNTNTLLPKAHAGQSIGLVLQIKSHHLDSSCPFNTISRGYWLSHANEKQILSITKNITANLIWLDPATLNLHTNYWIKHQHTWCIGTITAITQQLDTQTGAWKTSKKPDLKPKNNDIIHVHIQLQTELPVLPYTYSRKLGSFIIVDPQTCRTISAGLIT